MNWLSKAWARLRNATFNFPAATLVAVFVTGIVFWGGFNWTLELTNTERFCISCHAMKEYLYAEYRTSVHHTNRTGVRASCPDCHVPREWVHKVVRKVRATNELYHWLRGSIDSREDFEGKRFELAGHVWTAMEATDSRECRNCHGEAAMRADAQHAMAGTMHVLADNWSMTCIDCHKGIAHTLPKEYDAEAAMDALHERMEREEIVCTLCHEDMVKPPKGEGWD